MFQQFLDPTMSYSSALFTALEPAPSLADLETAQLRKVDAHPGRGRRQRGRRVLEIGSGWGTLAIRPPSAARR